MKLRKTVLLAVAFAAFGAVAQAEVNVEALVTQLQSEGYTRIEVTRGRTQVKVEAIRGTEKVETIYDAVTGAILKTENEAVRPQENTNPGVRIRDRNRDFVKSRGSDDDDDDDNDDDDNGSNDNDDDDNGSNDDDDNGGDDDDNGGDDDDNGGSENDDDD